MFHTSLVLDIILLILVFICIPFFLKLINSLPTLQRTSLIEISIATNSAQGGSIFKLTKRTKIDSNQILTTKLRNIWLLHNEIIYICSTSQNFLLRLAYPGEYSGLKPLHTAVSFGCWCVQPFWLYFPTIHC